MKKYLILFAFLLLLPGASFSQTSVPPEIKKQYLEMPEPAAANREGMAFEPYFASNWYKGNTHCHSDTDGERMPRHGDGPPENTLNWYADHDYDFIVFTDHNYWHEGLEAPEGLLYIKGEEITTMKWHVNGLGIKSYIRPAFGEDKITAYQRAIDDVLAQGGVPVLNHPITPLAFVTADDFKALENIHHFEVINAQPGSYNALAEPLWDQLLTQGYVFYGMATDDAHKFVHKNPLIGDPPGGGFIMVDALDRSQEKILQAIREGKFYSSTGVLLQQYKVTAESIQVWVEAEKPCRIEFIGAKGEVLETAEGLYGIYRVKGDELYVRVKVTDEDGKVALTQPVFYK